MADKNKPDHTDEEVGKWFEDAVNADNEKWKSEYEKPPSFKKGEGVEDVPAATDDSI